MQTNLSSFDTNFSKSVHWSKQAQEHTSNYLKEIKKTVGTCINKTLVHVTVTKAEEATLQ